MDALGGATPSLSEITEEVYGDPNKKTAVRHHIKALHEWGTISDNPILKGHIALTDPEKTRKQVDRARQICSRKGE
jgi:hypothetical protein